MGWGSALLDWGFGKLEVESLRGCCVGLETMRSEWYLKDLLVQKVFSIGVRGFLIHVSNSSRQSL